MMRCDAPPSVKAGVEVTNDYGLLSSEHLLLNYGFVPAEPSADDFYDISLDQTGNVD